MAMKFMLALLLGGAMAGGAQDAGKRAASPAPKVEQAAAMSAEELAALRAGSELEGDEAGRGGGGVVEAVASGGEPLGFAGGEVEFGRAVFVGEGFVAEIDGGDGEEQHVIAADGADVAVAGFERGGGE